jgi:hypothetical protein
MALGRGVADGLSSSEPIIRAQFDKSITKAILVSDAIKLGLRAMVTSAMGSLPGQMAAIMGSTLRGGGLSEEINIQLQNNTATSTLAALTDLNIAGAADQIDLLNKRLMNISG